MRREGVRGKKEDVEGEGVHTHQTVQCKFLVKCVTCKSVCVCVCVSVCVCV